jgi:hypothetical protein
VPAEADHLTPTLAVFLTRAVNCTDWEDATEALSGVMLTAMDELEACARERLGLNASARSAHIRGECFLMIKSLQNYFLNFRKAARKPTRILRRSNEVANYKPQTVDKCL